MRIGQAGLFSRCNRRLSYGHQVIRRADDERTRQENGDYYVVDYHRGVVVNRNVNLHDLACSLGVFGAKRWKPYPKAD